MTILLMLPFLFSGFMEKWYMPKGTSGPYGRILVCDSDRDLQIELIFGYSEGFQDRVEVYELYPDSSFYLETTIDTMSTEAWAVGDFDADGLFDVVLSGDFGLPVIGPQIYESPDSFSYPTQEVWRDTVGFALVQPISTYDVDNDGVTELFKLGWKKEDSITIYYPFGVYESIGNNQYDTVFMGTGLGSLSSTIAFGDFDNDDNNEFVVGNMSGWYQIWECLGNNSYQEFILQQLPTFNIKDCFSVPDADGDSRPEFVIKGFVIPSAEIHAFIFEAIADNTYQIIKSFTLPGGDYGGGYSEAGDVDGDSISEIVLEARQNVFIIKAAGNDSFYVWDTLPGHTNGSCVRVYDIDGNGLAEIIISGNNETSIYEYDPDVVQEKLKTWQLYSLFMCTPSITSSDLVVKYTLSHKTNVVLSLYDNAGRLVKQLCVGEKHPGTHTEKLSLKGYPNGVYHLILETPDGINTKKFVKIR